MQRYQTHLATLLLALLTTTMISLGGCASLTTMRSTASPGALPDEFTAENIGQYYVKREFRIPMRDGVRLHTKVLIPKDRSKEHPILLRRTPYSCAPYGPGEFSRGIGRYDRYLRDNYILAFQDVRGTYMSEGEFVNMRPHNPARQSPNDFDESTDAHDTIEWLINNVPSNNGNVGMWGISYPGFYAAASMIDAHPALKAVSPQAPIADWWFDDFHHHGAFFLPHCFRFISSFGLPRPEPTTRRPRREFEIWSPDGYAFYLDMGPLKNANERYLKGNVEFWNKTVAHPNYDEFWQSRNILPHLNDVAPAVMTVGGWFDAEDLYGPLQIYRSVEQKNPDVFNILVMGPWAHGGWSRGAGDRLGNAYFGGPTSPWYQEHIEKKFFDHYLRDGKTSSVDLPEATVFETGANEWREFDVWPPANATEARMYLHADGSMNFNRPTSARSGYREYISDPDKPVPFTEEIAQGMTRAYMTDDQRFAGRRPDVLVYQTDVLEEDLTIAGPIIANLMVSTSGTDSDWIVKVIDVHPHDAADFPDIREGTRTAGYQMMVRSEVMRGRFRNSYEHPEGFVPNEPTLVRLPLQDVLHTFKKGHRLMVQIQSTWFPLIDRNPQQFVPNIFLADEEDFITATQRVYASPEHATWLEIGVLD